VRVRVGEKVVMVNAAAIGSGSEEWEGREWRKGEERGEKKEVRRKRNGLDNHYSSPQRTAE